MGKGEIARYEQLLLFPQCFQKACFPGASKGVIVWEWVKGLAVFGEKVKVFVMALALIVILSSSSCKISTFYNIMVFTEDIYLKLWQVSIMDLNNKTK